MENSLSDAKEVAYRVGGVALAQHHGIDHVAEGLAHLNAVEHQPAVAENLLGQRDVQHLEHDRPDYRMEADDLLAHDVLVGRPVLFKQRRVFGRIAQGGNVVGQRVQPYIDYVAAVDRHGYAPRKRGARYAQILKAGAQEVGQHLVGAGGGLYEVGMRLDVVNQPILILGYFEEVGLLLNLLHGAAAVGAVAVLGLSGRPERLAGRAVQTLVSALIYVAALVQLHEYVLHGLYVALVGGADEVGIVHVHQRPQFLYARDDLVHVLLRRYACGLGLVFDLLAVLVGAGQKIGIVAGLLLKARHSVGRYRTERMADMQFIAGIIYRRGNVVCLISHYPYLHV